MTSGVKVEQPIPILCFSQDRLNNQEQEEIELAQQPELGRKDTEFEKVDYNEVQTPA